MDYLKYVSGVGIPRPPVTSSPSCSLYEVVGNAVTTKVHRIWVTDHLSRLLGVVSFSDVIQLIREASFGGN